MSYAKTDLPKLLAAGAGIVLVSFFILLSFKVAQNKPFWTNEGYDIGMIAPNSFHDLLLGDTLQSNNNPLYYLLQKLNLSLIHHHDQFISIKFRMVSIISAALVLAAVYWFACTEFGILWAMGAG